MISTFTVVIFKLNKFIFINDSSEFSLSKIIIQKKDVKKAKMIARNNLCYFLID